MSDLVEPGDDQRRRVVREEMAVDAMKSAKVAHVLQHDGHVLDVAHLQALRGKVLPDRVIREPRLGGDRALAAVGMAAAGREEAPVGIARALRDNDDAVFVLVDALFDARQERGLLYPGASLKQVFALGKLASGTYRAIVFADSGEDAVFASQYTLKF